LFAAGRPQVNRAIDGTPTRGVLFKRASDPYIGDAASRGYGNKRR